MLATIKKDRPVISIGIYHSVDEFFCVKALLDQSIDNYTYRIALFNHIPTKEYTLIGWPNEINPPTSWWWVDPCS